MSFLVGANVVLIGILAGMLAVIAAMAVILGAFVKVPGGASARFWALGSSLILIGASTLMLQRDNTNYLFGMLVMGLFLAGHVLQWQGLQIFYFKARGKKSWRVAGVFWLAYSLLLWNDASFSVRLAYASLVPIVVWPMCMAELLKADHRPYKFATRLAIAGLLLMIGDAGFEIVIGLFSVGRDLLLEAHQGLRLAETIVPILGSLLYMAALILLYFERAAEQANYAATHDELTGLLNRRAIIASGEHEIDLARRSHQSLAVAFVDIDYFKKINDEYGHDTGDVVLSEVARILATVCRSIDLVGRYGGEEFCLIFPGDHHGGAEIVGERIVSAVAAHQFAGLPSVTVSVGLAVLPISDTAHTWHSLIQQADIELYKAKQNGRNRYSIHGKPFEKNKVGRSSGKSTLSDHSSTLFRHIF